MYINFTTYKNISHKLIIDAIKDTYLHVFQFMHNFFSLEFKGDDKYRTDNKVITNAFNNLKPKY